MNNLKKFLGIILACIVIFSLVGCGTKNTASTQKEAEKEESIKLMDCAGREVTVPADVNRIVDLQIDGTKTLIQLGKGDKIVGLTGRALQSFKASESEKSRFKWSVASRVLPKLKELPSIGNFKEPNIEKIISLNPDVIFAPVSAKGNADELEKKTGAVVLCMSNFASLDFEMLRIVGKLTGEEGKAEEIISYSEKIIKDITDVTSQIPEDERVKVFIIIPPTDLSGNTYRTMSNYDPLELAGGINLAKAADVKAANWETSKEHITAWNPDIILFYDVYQNQDLNRESILNSIIDDQILKDVNAIKNKKIYPYMGWNYGWDTATGVVQVPYMAKLFYPERFKDLDVEKVCNEILKKYYNIDNLYSEMAEKNSLVMWKTAK